MMKYLICFNFEQFILIMERLFVGGTYIELLQLRQCGT